jgi:hypothetical protein
MISLFIIPIRRYCLVRPGNSFINLARIFSPPSMSLDASITRSKATLDLTLSCESAKLSVKVRGRSVDISVASREGKGGGRRRLITQCCRA